MNQAPEVDVERIMERIRQDIRGNQRVGADPPGQITPFADGHAAMDLAHLHNAYDIQSTALVSHRRMLGRVVASAKKAVRRLLAPVLERQVAYNAANTRVVTALRDWVDAMDRDHRAAAAEQMGVAKRHAAELRQTEVRLRDEAWAVESRLRADIDAAQARLRESAAEMEQARAVQAALRDEVQRMHAALLAEQAAARDELRAGQARLRDELGAARERATRAERRLRRILHARSMDDADAAPPVREPAPDAPIPPHDAEPFDYSGFEERFRGNEEEIKARQRMYLDCFEGRANVVDIGCGRGEFLELMREGGIPARGVDVDLDMVLLCRDKDLDVRQQDAFGFLSSVEDDSLGGIFAAQVIEHLPPRRVVELVRLCRQKLAADGVLVLETPNPKCLMIFADTFYKDLSHFQPLHPDTMQFVLESLGFHHVEVRFSSPVDEGVKLPFLPVSDAEIERFNQGIDRLNGLLFGYLDYAVVGRKLAATTTPADPAAARPAG